MKAASSPSPPSSLGLQIHFAEQDAGPLGQNDEERRQGHRLLLHHLGSHLHVLRPFGTYGLWRDAHRLPGVHQNLVSAVLRESELGKKSLALGFDLGLGS